MDLAATIRAQRFTPQRLRGGYDMEQVDTYLARIVAELGKPEAERDHQFLSSGTDVRFTPRMLGEGYNMDEVDAFLDLTVIPGLAAITGTPLPEGAGPLDVIATYLERSRFSTAKRGEVYAIDDIEGLRRAALDALRAPGDEAERRRGALAVLEGARIGTASDRAKGYARKGVDERMGEIVQMLRSA